MNEWIINESGLTLYFGHIVAFSERQLASLKIGNGGLHFNRLYTVFTSNISSSLMVYLSHATSVEKFIPCSGHTIIWLPCLSKQILRSAHKYAVWQEIHNTTEFRPFYNSFLWSSTASQNPQYTNGAHRQTPTSSFNKFRQLNVLHFWPS